MLGTGLSGAAWAAQPITITNAGFEDPVLGEGTLQAGAPGWTAFNGGNIAVLNPGVNDLGAGAPEGENVGLVISSANEDGLAQTLTSTFQIDASYVLTVKVANTKLTAGFPGYRVQLVVNNTVLAEEDNTQFVAEDAVVPVTVSYSYAAGDAGLLGQPLAIRLLSKGLATAQEVAFDDVKLTVTLTNPVANPGGPYTVPIGGSLSLDGSASLPSDGESITTWEWDLNNDDDFSDASGATPASISADDLVNVWGMGLGANTIRLRVTDSAAKTSTPASTTVTLSSDLFWDGGSEDILTDGDGASQGGAGTWNTTLLNWDAGADMPHVAWSNSSNSSAIFGGAAGVVTLATDITVGGLTFNTSGYTLSGQTLTFGTAGTIFNNVTATINSVLAGALPITKSGTGQLTLGGVNQHSGGTVVNSGTLRVSSDANLGDPAGGITFNGTPTFGNDGNWTIGAGRTVTLNAGARPSLLFGGGTIAGPVVGSGGFGVSKVSQGNAGLNLTNTNNTFTGPIWLGDKGASGFSSYTFNSLGDAPGAGIISLGYGGQGSLFIWGSGANAPLVLDHRQFDFGGSSGSTIRNSNTASSHANTITINTDMLVTGAGSRPLTLGGTNTGDNTFAGIIPDGPSGTVVSLTKADAGTWVLSGENTYSGATTIGAGRLLINGDQSAASGAVAVNGTSTLGGSGTIGGSVTVAAGARIVPGTSVGTLSILGGLDISAMAGGAGTLGFELDTVAASDRIVVGGTLTIGSGTLGLNDFVFTDLGGLQDGVYKLITSGAAVNGTLDAGNRTGTIGGFDVELKITGNDIELWVGDVGLAGYALWAATNAPTGNPDDDYDGDGVSNAVEFVLGGDKDTNDLGKLPVPANNGTDMTFTFVRDQASIDASTVVSIEVSPDLTDWSETYAVPGAAAANNPGVTVSKDVPAVGEDTVTLTVPAAGAKKFARMRVVIAP